MSYSKIGTSNPNYRHGLYGTKEYKGWLAMRWRCSPKNKGCRKDYYDNGITCCKEWDNFEQFFRDTGYKPDGMTLERIDGTKGYYKENCKWATRVEQNRNQRNTINMDTAVEVRKLFSTGMTNKEICKELKLTYNVVYGITTNKCWL